MPRRQWIGRLRSQIKLLSEFRTKSTVATSVFALVLLLGVHRQAKAEDPHMGIIEFEISCMPCHGIDGRGNGRLAGTLKTPPVDLTCFAKSNGGIFPADKVAEMIDGRAIVAAHGEREMPVWGDRYRRTVETNEPAAKIERRAVAQIGALVRYLETIQQK